MVVYQAYKPAIASFAVKNQYLGGSDSSYSRISWIKPNFLRMMLRCDCIKGKPGKRIGLWMEKKDLDSILQGAVASTYKRDQYNTREEWQADLNNKQVRLQWSPDYDP